MLRQQDGGEKTIDTRGRDAQATDEATFSAEALALARGGAEPEERNDDVVGSTEAEAGEEAAGGEALTEAERQQVDKLKSRDAEVRAHEAAHMAAGGAHVRGGANYTYQQGPDGKQYAIGGEVGIDVSSIPDSPQATIQKMQQVRAAALAPAEPSGADRSVAAKAAEVEAQAREQLAAKGAERVSSRYAEAQKTDAGGIVNETA